jgi:hypothetical protein
MRRRRGRKGKPDHPLVCQLARPDGRPCGAPIGWIPGVRYPVNTGSIEILLYEKGSPQIHGVTIHGDECSGRRREAGEDGRVVEVWTRHICEHKSGRPLPPAPDPEQKWGADRAAGGDEE